MEAKKSYRQALSLIQRSTWLLACSIDEAGFPDNAYRVNLANTRRFPALAKKIDYKKLENYFPLNRYSTRFRQAMNCPKTSLYYYDVTTGEICQLKGFCTLVKDPKICAQFWQQDWENQFPDGVNDPDFALMRFEARDLQYYDGTKEAFWGMLHEALQKPKTKTTPKL